MIGEDFMQDLKVKVNGDKLNVGRYQVPIGNNIEVIDKNGEVVLKGKVLLKVYMDGECYIDCWHIGFEVKVIESKAYSHLGRLTLGDLILDCYNENWKIKEVCHN